MFGRMKEHLVDRLREIDAAGLGSGTWDHQTQRARDRLFERQSLLNMCSAHKCLWLGSHPAVITAAHEGARPLGLWARLRRKRSRVGEETGIGPCFRSMSGPEGEASTPKNTPIPQPTRERLPSSGSSAARRQLHKQLGPRRSSEYLGTDDMILYSFVLRRQRADRALLRTVPFAVG